MKGHAGENPPKDVFVFVETTKDDRCKYVWDEKIEELFLKKVFERPSPTIYGHIPKTHIVSEKQLGCFVITHGIIRPGTFVSCRPVGVVRTVNDAVVVDRLIAVAIGDKENGNIKNLDTLSQSFKDDITKVLQIEGYKKIEFFDVDKAEKVVEHAIELYKRKYD